LEQQKEGIQKDLEATVKREKNWKNKCTYLEMDVERLRKENEEFYSVDKFSTWF
jgi:hypothetical protein